MPKQRKRVDPIKQREQRAKIAAAVGGVVFLIVCAIEVPSLMSSLNHQAPPPAAAATTPAPASSAPPLADVAAPPAAAASASPGPGELPNTDVPPAPTDGSQLVSFSVFQTKNPFTPQVPAGSGAVAGPTAAGTTPTATTPAATVATTPTRTTTTTPPAGTSTTPAPPAAPPVVSAVPPAPTAPTATTTAPQPTVAISVNGVVAHAAENDTFPSGGPVFRLVSWTRTTAQIGIVGGSYATGDPTLTVQLGVPVTLENQTDGKRYKLLLLSTPTP